MSYASKVEKFEGLQNELLELENKRKQMAKALRVESKRNEGVAYRLIGKAVIEGAIDEKCDMPVSFILSHIDAMTKDKDIRTKIKDLIAKVQDSKQSHSRKDAAIDTTDTEETPAGKEKIDDELTRMIENL